MMKQYMDIRKQYPDCLLFYRMGDFYELFLEDAYTGARILNITLTGKSNGSYEKIPMAGVPYHAVDAYLLKLVKAGYKVAICEQLSPPNKKGLVERDVVRIVTPGTMLDEKSLEKKDNNYIISLATGSNMVAISTADISTGYFTTTEIPAENIEQVITDELARLHPSECILPENLYNDPQLLRILKTEKNLNIFPFQTWNTYAVDAKSVLKQHFGVGTLAGFGVEHYDLALQTAAALLGYLQQTQKGPVNHIKKITPVLGTDYLLLDRSTMLNLELFSTIREHDTRGTLVAVMDHTLTGLGGRKMKQWMRKPLTDQETIIKRHDAVEALLADPATRQLLRDKIKEVSDIERMLSRLSVGLGNARDLISLKNSLECVLEIKELLLKIDSELIKELAGNIRTQSFEDISTSASYRSEHSGSKISPQSNINEIEYKSPRPLGERVRVRGKAYAAEHQTVESIIALIDKYITDEPPISLREGGLIKSGIDKELDKLRKIVGGSRDWILEMEKTERERTGISSLKVRYNQVFGFYIEVSKSNLHLAPAHYTRKQTLVNGERFITPELKEQEEIILTSEQKINDLEYRIFQEVLQKILAQTSVLQETAESIAAIDCLVTFAHIAEKNNYTRPKILNSGEIRIKGGRHPVVEHLLENKQFVPNDLYVGTQNVASLHLITGPNMAGKSVFIRQTALIVLMAQMGSFVPAEEAHISLVDRIFVRSGASDVITSGLSTFMVEMVETAHILHHATKNSLIIMDEIGRGTSTYDGISIAWAVAEYLVTHLPIPPKTLFATHYHELQVLEDQHTNKVKNFHMAVADDQGEPVFLHTILPGGASHSFGVAVAKLAGIPEPVINRANQLLADLEKRNIDQPAESKVIIKHQQVNLAEHLVHKELANIDIHQMTPLEALNKLSELKEKLKLFQIHEKDVLRFD